MRGAVIVVGLLVMSVLRPGTALAESLVESLQGAWTLVGTSCSESFEFSAGKPKFKDRGSSLNTGVIISGDKIAGPSSTCTASHISESQGQYTVHMSCADAIMFSSVTVSLAIIDPQHFNRIDPDFSEDNYQKCMPAQ